MTDLNNGDDLFPSLREHANHDEAGYCCPHCCKDTSPDFTVKYNAPKALTCAHCGKIFAVWKEKITEHVSGFAEEE